MVINFNITERDYLTLLLFDASKSKRIIRRRKIGKYLVPIFYVPIAILFYFSHGIFFALPFFIVAILWYFIAPKWSKRRFVKSYEAIVKENYKNMFGQILEIQFDNDFIFLKRGNSESKIDINEVEEINEIEDYIFIKLKNGSSIIIPKHIKKIGDLLLLLSELSNRLNVKYNINNNWKWQ